MRRSTGPDISFTIHEERAGERPHNPYAGARRAGRKAVKHRGGVAKLSVVGIGMRSHSGVAAGCLHAWDGPESNIQMVSTSEIKLL